MFKQVIKFLKFFKSSLLVNAISYRMIDLTIWDNDQCQTDARRMIKCMIVLLSAILPKYRCAVTLNSTFCVKNDASLLPCI